MINEEKKHGHKNDKLDKGTNRPGEKKDDKQQPFHKK